MKIHWIRIFMIVATMIVLIWAIEHRAIKNTLRSKQGTIIVNVPDDKDLTIVLPRDINVDSMEIICSNNIVHKIYNLNRSK